MSKNFDFPTQLDIIITCASGVEKVVKSELARLGYPSNPAINGAITFQGDLLAVARCNINLRSADRVFIKVAQFPVSTFDQLFDGVNAIDWRIFLPSDAKVNVNGKCVKSKIFAISACQSIVKKAIVEKLSSSYKINHLQEDGSLYEVEFSIFKDVCTIMLNTSGGGLHKRGYRDMVGIAPIKETLASALLLMSDFYWDRPFLDPFCGSGTLVIEGAKIALNIAPNLDRKFLFNNWKNFDSKIYSSAVEEALDKQHLDRKIDFSGSDIDPKAIKLASHHAQRAGLEGRVKFSVCDVKNLKIDKPFGTIVTNPPYGERVYDIQEALECYKNLGNALKDKTGWSAFVITSCNTFERHFGRRCDRERKLYNSNKECRLYYYYGKKEKLND